METLSTWKVFLASSNFSFNEEVTCGFLVASLLSDDKSTFIDSDNRICIDVFSLKSRLSPKIVTSGLDLLIKNYFLVEQDGVYVLGEQTGLIDSYLYLYNRYRKSEVTKDPEGLNYINNILEEYYEPYLDFCMENRKRGQAEKVLQFIKRILNLPENRITGTILVEFLNLINAVVFKYKEVSFSRPMVKELSVAKAILNKAGSPKEALLCATYFSVNFSSFSDRIVTNPDIFKLSYKFSDIKHKMATLANTNNSKQDHF